MLGLERGKSDLPIFCLLLLACWLYRRCGEAFSHPIVFAIGTVKFYPFVALLGLIRPTWRSWGASLGFGAGVLTYMLFAFTSATQNAQLGSTTFAWGFRVIFQVLPPWLARRGTVVPAWTLREMLPIIGLLALVLVILGWQKKASLSAFVDAQPDECRIPFLMGCAIYSGCFLLSVNYLYRNLFLFMLLPHLFRTTSGRKITPRLARWMLGAIEAVFLLSWLRDDFWFFVLGQVCYWLLFCLTLPLCVAALMASRPQLGARRRNADGG